MNLLGQLQRNHIMKNHNVKKGQNSNLRIDQKIYQRLYLIAFLHKDKESEMEHGIHILKKYFAEVDTIIFSVEKADKLNACHQFTKLDFNFLKSLKKEHLCQLDLSKNYDIVMVYNPLGHHEIEYLASLISARVRLGTNPEFSEMYNILYELPPSADFKRFLQEIMQFIKSFRTHA
jgi:hypothetical protein